MYLAKYAYPTWAEFAKNLIYVRVAIVAAWMQMHYCAAYLASWRHPGGIQDHSGATYKVRQIGVMDARV
jgi:hypothetical protein